VVRDSTRYRLATTLHEGRVRPLDRSSDHSPPDVAPKVRRASSGREHEVLSFVVVRRLGLAAERGFDVLRLRGQRRALVVGELLCRVHLFDEGL